MTVAIVSPGYPTANGGVTDHTARLMRHWVAAGEPTRVLGLCDEPPAGTVHRWRAEGVRAILIQYVPFLYGRRGLSRFPRRLALEARTAGLRVGVFVHEPWVPKTRLPWLLLSPLQRRQLLRLVKACDVVCTPVPAWRTLLSRGTGGAAGTEGTGGGGSAPGRVHLVYVGSTLSDPPSPSSPPGPPLPAPVVFSPFAAGLNWDWIVAAVHAIGVNPGLTVLGASWEAAQRHRDLSRLADPAWDWRGYLDPAAALSLLKRAPVVLAPYVDGLTGRRTSAFAAASAGASVLSSRGPLFDPALDQPPFVVADTRDRFCQLAVKLYGERAGPAEHAQRARSYRQRFAADQLDQRLLDLLLAPGSKR